MSKELPYFKFNVSEWLLGRISDENYRVQGIFLSCCCYYWHQECELNTNKLNKKIGKTNAKLMIDLKFIVQDFDKITIPFLDEQYSELTALREKRSAAGKKGGEARTKQSLSGAKATDKHIDKDIEIDKDIDKDKSKNVGVYSKEVNICFDNCLLLFPLDARPKNDTIKGKWLDTIDKLLRIDKIPLNTIYEVVRKTRSNDFWKSNFLSIQKLRKKDKNDVMYFTVFREATKQNSKETIKNVADKNIFEKLN